MTTFSDDIKARLENGQIIFRRMTVVRLVSDTIELEADSARLRSDLAAAQAENAQLKSHNKWHDDVNVILTTENARLRAALESMTPGGSEFHDSPDNCLEFIRGRLDTVIKIAKDRNELRAALEKVEWVDVGYGKHVCPWCHIAVERGHAIYCPRQSTLHPSA